MTKQEITNACNTLINNLPTHIAHDYERETDQYLFCLYYLDLSFCTDGEDFCDRMVNRMEDKIDTMLKVTI